MPYRVGELAGQYEVVKLLGRGACGEVFQVRDDSGTFYAMKAVPCDPDGPSATAAMRAREAALAEAKMLQGLKHPNIVACEDVLYDDEQHIVRLILEHMDGGDLQRHLAARREEGEAFPPQFAYRMLTEVGDALNFIHAVGVLHRDVKPANILLAAGACQIKLGDFGIAKLVEAATLKAHSMVGTPYYLSPELVAGQAYGAATDCWALGACLYETLTLRRAFEAGNQLALMRLICEEDPPPLPAATPEHLREVIQALLAKDPEQRMVLTEAIRLCAGMADVAADEGRECVLADPDLCEVGKSPESMDCGTTHAGAGWGADPASSDEEESTWADTVDTEAILKRASLWASEAASAATVVTLQLPSMQESTRAGTEAILNQASLCASEVSFAATVVTLQLPSMQEVPYPANGSPFGAAAEVSPPLASPQLPRAAPWGEAPVSPRQPLAPPCGQLAAQVAGAAAFAQAAYQVDAPPHHTLTGTRKLVLDLRKKYGTRSALQAEPLLELESDASQDRI